MRFRLRRRTRWKTPIATRQARGLGASTGPGFEGRLQARGCGLACPSCAIARRYHVRAARLLWHALVVGPLVFRDRGSACDGNRRVSRSHASRSAA